MERRPATIEDALREWLDEIAFSRAPKTIETYRTLLKLPPARLDELDRAYCRHWLAEQIRRRKPAGANACRDALSSFCRWLVGRGWLALNPMEGVGRVKVPEPPPSALSEAAVARLWQAAGELDGNAALECTQAAYHAGPTRPIRPDSITNRLLLAFLSAGLRRSEVAGLRWADLDLASRKARILGKGSKIRTVLIPKAAVELLRNPVRSPLVRTALDSHSPYSHPIGTGGKHPSTSQLHPLSSHRRPRQDTVGDTLRSETANEDQAGRASREFGGLSEMRDACSRQAQKHRTTGTIFGVSDEAIYQRFKRIAKRAGIPKIWPHLLRHTFATSMLAKGMSPLALQTLGGWANQAMVRKYAAAALADAALEEMRRLE